MLAPRSLGFHADPTPVRRGVLYSAVLNDSRDHGTSSSSSFAATVATSALRFPATGRRPDPRSARPSHEHLLPATPRVVTVGRLHHVATCCRSERRRLRASSAASRAQRDPRSRTPSPTRRRALASIAYWDVAAVRARSGCTSRTSGSRPAGAAPAATASSSAATEAASLLERRAGAAVAAPAAGGVRSYVVRDRRPGPCRSTRRPSRPWSPRPRCRRDALCSAPGRSR